MQSIPEKQRKQIEFIDEIYDKIVLKKTEFQPYSSSNLKEEADEDKENQFKTHHYNIDSLDSQNSQIEYNENFNLQNDPKRTITSKYSNTRELENSFQSQRSKG